MGSRIGPRRRWVRGVGMALTVVVASVLASSATPASAQDPDGIVPEGDWTEEQADTLRTMVDDAERVLPDRFPASGSAEEIDAELSSLGFVDIGAVAPGGWSHYVNVGWFNDEHLFNPEYAESLVYRRGADGQEELVAAMYFHNLGITMDNIPEEDAWLPGWHTHPELCSDEQGRVRGFTPPGTNNCPEGTAPADGPPMIHTWIIDNECGHRFGGVDAGGIHCDYEHEHDDGGHDDGGHDDGEHDDGEHDDGDHGGVAGPAPAISGDPGFTG